MMFFWVGVKKEQGKDSMVYKNFDMKQCRYVDEVAASSSISFHTIKLAIKKLCFGVGCYM